MLTSLLTSCSPNLSVEALSTSEATLASAGKRLIKSHSTGDLTRLAARGDRVLASLTREERDALSRNYLRFRIDRPSDVVVAAPQGSALFWLADQGFRSEGLTLADGALTWNLYRKTFAPGSVGLGVNGLDASPLAHYAVFVRPTDGGPTSVVGFDEEGWKASDASKGVRLERDVAASIRDLPEALRNSTLLSTTHDRRNVSRLARGRVWKTHVVAQPTPDQVTVAFGADASSELVWSWRTDPGPKPSTVRLRKLGKSAERSFGGSSEIVALPDLLNDPENRRHTVIASGLEPATAYEYAVGDGPPTWMPIRTVPKAGSDVSLMYMGDPQCGLEKWGELLASAYRRRPDVSALLIAGDLVDRGNERTNWDHFFLRAAGTFDRLPLMPAVGNHEYLDRGPWLYRKFFALPDNGPKGTDRDLVYYFEIGDAFVAVLDSTLAVFDPVEARRQADWLDEQLLRTRRTWKFVMFHHPLYASHPSREYLGLRDAWTPVIDRHRVDLVLQGHDHAYLRTYPMRGNRRVGSPAEGTVYVVAVSGDKYCEQPARNYTEVGFTHVSTYQTIDLKTREGRLVYRSFDATGKEMDKFTIDKKTDVRMTQSR